MNRAADGFRWGWDRDREQAGVGALAAVACVFFFPKNRLDIVYIAIATNST